MSSPDLREHLIYFRSASEMRTVFSRRREFPVKISGMYFGAEFCEHLTPSVSDLQSAAKEAAGRGWKFYWVSGAAAPSVMPAYRRLLERLAALPGGTGVVFNDWGVLEILRREMPSLDPVMGRMLFKNKRYVYRDIRPDGNISPERLKSVAKEQVRLMRRTSFDIAVYREFLQKLGIRKVDVDILPQGMDLRGSEGFDIGAHTPWGYLTSGRTCSMWPGGQRFPSAKSCQSGRRCVKGRALGDELEFAVQLQERGNTVLYRVPKGCPEGIRRLIHDACP